jgi:uncharacterized protein (DUF3084 family)
MGTALAILLLLALCGFIAYTGDLLGRRLGKKRLSVFGLRPKHTAVLLTVITGVLIAGFSFGAALAVVPGFRLAVTQGERLARTNRQLRAELRRLERQRIVLGAENERAARQNRELSERSRALATENQQLTARNRELSAQSTLLAGRNQALTRESAGLQQRNRELREASSALRDANRRLQESNRLLNEANTALNRDNAALRLRQQAVELREGRYLFRRNQQITYRPVPPNPPLPVLRDTVRAVLYEAEYPQGPGSRRPLAVQTPEGYTGNAGDHDTLCDWVARQAAGIRNRPLVVRLVAAENCVEGRPIRARFDWYANDLVFRQNQTIAETRVDGAASMGSVLEELVYFLQSEVRQRALARPNGMVPREEGIGELSYDQILAVCEQVRQVNGPARVVARARQDTYRAGPLNVDLEVSPLAAARSDDS